jgi:hypothetical protein
MKKEKIQAYVDKAVKEKLEAGCDGRSLSNHASNILTKHVSKQEVSHQAKKEMK